MILVLMRDDDTPRAPLVEQPGHGIPRAGKPGVDHLIAREEHEYRISHRRAAPGAQANQLDVVRHDCGTLSTAIQVQRFDRMRRIRSNL
jgi:hypothetical protein